MITVNFAGSALVEARLGQGRPLLVIGRFSDGSGRSGSGQAVADLFSAVRAVDARFGTDIERLLPDPDELADTLFSQPKQASTDARGKTFVNRFLTMDWAREHRVVLAVSAGSGRKTTTDHVQPAVAFHADLVNTHQPALVFATTFKRLGRVTWSLAPLANAVQHADACMADLRRPPTLLDDIGSLTWFLESIGGANEADEIFERTRRGSKRVTDERMEGGRARLGLSVPLPPGLCRLRLAAGVGTGVSIVALEDPATMPGRDEVAVGYPQVVDGDGQVINQVAIVQGILRRLADGQTKAAVGAWAVSQGFSSSVLRGRRRDPAARYGPAHLAKLDRGAGVLRGVIDNLEFYRTGTLRFSLGINGDEVVITGCAPEGGWLDPIALQRLDRIRAVGKARVSAAPRLTFVGLKGALHTDGQTRPVVLLYSASARDAEYRFVCDEQYPNRIATLSPARLPATDLAAAITDGIAAAGEVPLGLVSVTGDVEASRSQRDALADVHRQIGHLQASMAGQLQRVSDPAITGRMKTDLNVAYEAAADTLDALQVTADTLQDEIDRIHATRTGDRAELAAQELLKLVASLRDPQDRTHRHTWLTHITDLTITVIKATYAGRAGFTMRVEGALRVAHADGEVHIPFARDCPDRAIAEGHAAVTSAISWLREGVPWSMINVPLKRASLHAVRETLGVTSPRAGIITLSCADPTILRVAMATVYPANGTARPAEIVAANGVPMTLVHRIAAVHATRATSWLFDDHLLLAHLHLMARHTGTVTIAELEAAAGPQTLGRLRALPGVQGGQASLTASNDYRTFTVDACRTCDGWDLIAMRFREADGPVCLSCQTDRAGHHWPLDTYARYANGLQLLTAYYPHLSGFSAPTPPPTMPPSEAQIRAWLRANGHNVPSTGALSRAWRQTYAEQHHDLVEHVCNGGSTSRDHDG